MLWIAILKELATPIACVSLVLWIATDFKSRMEGTVKSLQKEVVKLFSHIKEHEEAMGKFRKAIEGTMLKIKEDAFDFKNTINNQVQLVSNNMGSMEKQCIVLGAQMTMAADKYNSQYELHKQMFTAINDCETKLKILMDKPGSSPRYFDDTDETWSGKK